jgi:hypothetical protein
MIEASIATSMMITEKDERAVGLAEFLCQGLALLHHGIGAPHHDREQPQKEQDRLQVVLGVCHEIRAEKDQDRGREAADYRRRDRVQQNVFVHNCSMRRATRLGPPVLEGKRRRFWTDSGAGITDGL